MDNALQSSRAVASVARAAYDVMMGKDLFAPDEFSQMNRIDVTTGSQLEVRAFARREDYERMVDYFLGADPAFLRSMGVDSARLPTRDAWLDSALGDHERPVAERERCYLAWIHGGDPIGHSSVNRIAVGEQAFIHLHLWVGGLRRHGLGTELFKASAAEFMRALRLKRIWCEPYAANPEPNRVLAKSGFRFVKSYRTIPGDINFEQDVNLYVLENPAVGRARRWPIDVSRPGWAWSHRPQVHPGIFRGWRTARGEACRRDTGCLSLCRQSARRSRTGCCSWHRWLRRSDVDSVCRTGRPRTC